MCVNIFKYTRVCVNIFKYVRVCVNILKHIHICVNKFKYIRVYVNIFKNLRACVNIYVVFVYVWIFLYILNIFTVALPYIIFWILRATVKIFRIFLLLPSRNCVHVHVNMYVFTSEKSKYIHILFMRICEYIYRSLPFTVYICTCVCNYSFVCTEMSTTAHPWLFVQVCMYIYPCPAILCIRACVFVTIHVCMCRNVHLCPSMIIWASAYIFTCVFKYFFTAAHPLLWICTCVFVCIHVCTWAAVSVSQVSMMWLRLVGSFKLQVSFAEYRLFARALLQKRQ